MLYHACAKLGEVVASVCLRVGIVDVCPSVQTSDSQSVPIANLLQPMALHGSLFGISLSSL